MSDQQTTTYILHTLVDFLSKTAMSIDSLKKKMKCFKLHEDLLDILIHDCREDYFSIRIVENSMVVPIDLPHVPV